MKLVLRKIFLLAALGISISVNALEPTYTALFSSNAIKGYDTVAYFTEGAPVKGTKQFSTEYQQATWWFASQQNLDLFLQSPEQYAPQYGGYCAYAVSQNTTASTEPELFTIVDGKLYLNYSEKINQQWSANKARFILDADNNWPSLLAE